MQNQDSPLSKFKKKNRKIEHFKKFSLEIFKTTKSILQPKMLVFSISKKIPNKFAS